MATNRQRHVLIVDDEHGPRASLKRALEYENRLWKVSTAASINEAKEIIYLGVDVVLTDLVLGANESGGIDVLHIAKERDQFTMIILFTAKEKRLDRLAAYQIGAFDCIEKNMLGSSSWEEINAKTKAALYFQDLTREHLESQSSALRRYFDPRLFTLLERNPSVLDVQTRNAAVAFWDIRNFSTLCMTTEPLLVRDLLVDYYNLATDIIFDSHGIVDKFIGDGVMGIFCDLIPGEFGRNCSADLVVSAAEAAISFRARFGEMQKEWDERLQRLNLRKKVDIGLGCGIHVGDSLIGRFDTKRRDHFTGIGPHVNLASRLQDCAVSGQILLSEVAAAELSTRNFDVSYMRRYELKNVGEHSVFQLNGRA